MAGMQSRPEVYDLKLDPRDALPYDNVTKAQCVIYLENAPGGTGCDVTVRLSVAGVVSVVNPSGDGVTVVSPREWHVHVGATETIKRFDIKAASADGQTILYICPVDTIDCGSSGDGVISVNARTVSSSNDLLGFFKRVGGEIIPITSVDVSRPKVSNLSSSGVLLNEAMNTQSYERFEVTIGLSQLVDDDPQNVVSVDVSNRDALVSPDGQWPYNLAFEFERSSTFKVTVAEDFTGTPPRVDIFAYAYHGDPRKISSTKRIKIE